MNERSKVSLNVYLFLKEENKILLSLRKNTGYEDGKWGLVAGHCENKEAATDALCREVKEEIGIIIDPIHLQPVHVMHRRTDRDNLDIFMKCNEWRGDITNLEPSKCESVEFFEINILPANIIPYIAKAIEYIQTKQYYSEHGWEKASL